ncbi:MAG: D-alanine--D-alanine ligase [Armatimonadetes bacterium]|nr:D-alanine--D-alanine ligase [Armatimonadota bacterium]
MQNKIKVAVLMGGHSSEREVSLKTGSMVLRALDAEKYSVLPVDPAGLLPPQALLALGNDSGTPGLPSVQEARDIMPLARALQSADLGRPDVAFLALHGRYGEDGTIQGLLELMGIPYTGSGVLASALAMDKIMTKRIFESNRIATPRFEVVKYGKTNGAFKNLRLPAVVKPNTQGSTIGISIVHEWDEMPEALALAARYDRDILVEEFVFGTEITAALLGNDNPQTLPLIEIVPSGGFYDYEAKYTPGATEEIVPARIPEKQAQAAREMALAAHNALGCRGMSRVDMIVNSHEIYALEVNTIPGMTPTSLLPRAAQATGISFPELVDRLIRLALED